MKDIENNNLAQALTDTKCNESDALASEANSPEQDFLLQHLYVPLAPTETGRRRHSAHQMQAPKFIQAVANSLQAEHSDMYFG